MPPQIVFRKVRADAKMPGTIDEIYYDMFACERTRLPANGRTFVRSGVVIETAPPRATIWGYPQTGAPTRIDPDSRAEISMCILNEFRTDFWIEPGEWIGQIAVVINKND